MVIITQVQDSGQTIDPIPLSSFTKITTDSFISVPSGNLQVSIRRISTDGTWTVDLERNPGSSSATYNLPASAESPSWYTIIGVRNTTQADFLNSSNMPVFRLDDPTTNTAYDGSYKVQFSPASRITFDLS